jgi:HD-GYP domain-containing protein (c-di-GMP phosphodiesterase class II)
VLKTVSLTDLELGMFVHKLEGRWIDHPFWKSRFLIEDDEKLDILRSSRLRGVVIDTSKGKDVGASAPQRMAPASSPAPGGSTRFNAIRKRSAAAIPQIGPVSMEQEISAAGAIAEKAKNSLNRTFIAARLGKAINVRSVEPVISDILASVRRNPQAFSGLMRCKLKNEVMFAHALSVSALMVSLARKMKLPPQDIHYCGVAGLLLDIGVNYLPPTIDPPGGDFRNADPSIWPQHVMLGYRALQNDGDLTQLVLDACLQHHERIDGKGFPAGLVGDEIAVVARMAAICDTFDFLLNATNTTAAMDPAAAIAHMRTMQGAFDDDILRLFIETVGIFPVGSFVTLRSGKIAMVIDEDSEDHTRPVVQAFYCLAQGERVLPHRIELAKRVGEDEITGIADLSAFELPDDAQLRELIFLSTYKNTS